MIQINSTRIHLGGHQIFAGKTLLKCEFRTAMYFAFKFDLNVITSGLDMHVNDKDVSRLTNCDWITRDGC